MEYTVIHGNNRVTQYNSYIGIDRDIKSDFIAVNISGAISGRGRNPIVWPVPCEIGLQAIVDVKRGTLRFGHDEMIGLTEFVVSTYDATPKPVLKEFTSIEDAQSRQTLVHVLDLIGEWPKEMPPQCELELIENCEWKYVNGKWVLFHKFSDQEFHEGHWLNYHENKKKYATQSVTAASMLQAALGHMEDRAKTYDTHGGERSMGKTVSAFNTITGLQLSEEQGWLFMEILKQVRSQQGNYRADNYEDMVAYASLRGECAARERGDK